MALNGFTLVGDSQLRRFAAFIGVSDKLCFSGCTISELKVKLKSSGPPKKVVLLIGSNDLMKNACLKNLKRDYVSLVKYLLRNCEQTILVVCPVIPRKISDRSHWEAVNYLNSLTYSFSAMAKVVDLKTHTSKMLSKPHYFEQHFYDGRVDLLHLNKVAFKNLLIDLQNAVSS